MLAFLLSAMLATSPDVQAWLKAADATRNAFDEAILTARATQVADGKVAGTADFDVYSKGRDKGLIVFHGGKNEGRKILTVGDRMWLLVPGAMRPVPITPNQRLMGGASIGDVARLSFSEDYTAALRPEPESVGGKTCRALDLTAKSPKAAYPKVVLWWNDAERLPAKVLFSLASGRPAKEVAFTKFAHAEGRTIVSEMEIRNLLSTDSRAITRLEYREWKPAHLDDRIFTPEGAKGL